MQTPLKLRKEGRKELLLVLQTSFVFVKCVLKFMWFLYHEFLIILKSESNSRNEQDPYGPQRSDTGLFWNFKTTLE